MYPFFLSNLFKVQDSFSGSSLQTFAVLDKFQLSKINLKDLQSLKLCWLNLQVLKGVLLPQDNRTLLALMWVYY